MPLKQSTTHHKRNRNVFLLPATCWKCNSCFCFFRKDKKRIKVHFQLNLCFLQFFLMITWHLELYIKKLEERPSSNPHQLIAHFLNKFRCSHYDGFLRLSGIPDLLDKVFWSFLTFPNLDVRQLGAKEIKQLV